MARSRPSLSLAVLLASSIPTLAEDHDYTNCLVVYHTSTCEGSGVFQAGYTTEFTGDYGASIPGECNAGPYRNVVGRAQCRELLGNWQDTCNSLQKDTCHQDVDCLHLQCGMCAALRPTSLTWACPAASQQPTGVHKTAEVKPSLAAAACTDLAEQPGWSLPVTASVAGYPAQRKEVNAFVTLHDLADELLLVDGIRSADSPTGWASLAAPHAPLNFTGLWHSGEPKEDATYVALQAQWDGGNLTAALYGVPPSAADSRALCVFARREVFPATAVPTGAPPGSCSFEEEVKGQHLAACTLAHCTTYSEGALAEAQEACCALENNTCIGVIVTPFGKYELGVGPILPTPLSAEGGTHLRTNESFQTPVPTPAPVYHDGLSPVLIGLLVLCVLFTLYCAGGVAVKAQQGETTCPELLPNHELWAACPGMMHACCISIYECVTTVRYGYGTPLDVDEMDMVDNDPIDDDEA